MPVLDTDGATEGGSEVPSGRGSADRERLPAASGPLVVAHRGSSEAIAEHTVGAYRRALEEGADGLECDVRLTADDELVCLHDRTLERTGGGPGIVSTMTLAQLRAVDWGAWKHGAGPDRDSDSGALITLRELLELAFAAGRELGVAIETKHPSRQGGRVEHTVAALLREYGLAGPRQEGQVWARMMSFSTLALRRMASLCPQLPLVFLQSSPVPPPYRGAFLPAGATTAGLDVALVRDRPEVVAVHHAAGHEVYVWTVDQPEDMRRCLDLGVEALITNRPSIALDLLGRNR
jgi:glycerophosphoryl diester phosphodiesterase